MRARTERARNPVKAAQQDAAKAEKFAAGREKELQDQIEQYALVNGCYVLRPPMHKRSQLPKGYPDLTIMRDARCCCVEAKAEGGKLDEDQAACHMQLNAANIPVIVAWNFESSAAFIRRHLL